MKLHAKIQPTPGGRFLWVIYDAWGAIYQTGKEQRRHKARAAAKAKLATITNLQNA